MNIQALETAHRQRDAAICEAADLERALRALVGQVDNLASPEFMRDSWPDLYAALVAAKMVL